jgi:hypothetical protein
MVLLAAPVRQQAEDLKCDHASEAAWHLLCTVELIQSTWY